MYSRLDPLFCVAFTDHHSFSQSQQIVLTVSSDKHLWNHCSSTPFRALPQLSTWCNGISYPQIVFCKIKQQPNFSVGLRQKHTLQGDHVHVLEFSEKLKEQNTSGQWHRRSTNSNLMHQLHPSHTCLTAKYLTSLICTKLINPSLLTLINWYNSDVSCDVPFYY